MGLLAKAKLAQQQAPLTASPQHSSALLVEAGPGQPHLAPPQSAQRSIDASHISEKLRSIVHENQLQPWWAGARLDDLCQRLATVDFDRLAAEWRISRQVVCDLVSLALFDVVFFVDDSGSMVFEENGSRLDDLKFILAKTATVSAFFDEDGIQVRFMNGDLIGEGLRTEAQVESLVARARFAGMTPLGTQFKAKVVDPLVLGPAITGRLNKPVLAVIVTDGEPTREAPDALQAAIVETHNTLLKTQYGPGALSIQIAQVGTDEFAQRFLSRIDQDPSVGGMVDCTSNYEMESEEMLRRGAELSPEMWLLKLCLGAVDRGYDDADG
ncbi:hypothetical protein HK105_208236 [Polyrhizophydium stewartii]|uniref:VWFA domain-containing protein n=1 Tax=Polyrhizophydium stewartii TaxID=2732419 RepID=A0ABR4MY97_9FUNG